mgnify:CR=1 FL=1
MITATMKEIKVHQLKYKTTRAPNELYSGGLAPCIAIGAIYGKKGYMYHAHPVGHNFSSHVEPIFRDLRRDVKDKTKLQIYVVGGEIEVNDEYENEVKAGRQTVLDKIAQSGFEKCIREVRWCPTDYAQSLRLILSEGRAEIEECPLEDLLK